MSDEKKDEKKQEPLGCLGIMLVVLTAVLVVLVLVCYEKVELSELWPLVPDANLVQSHETKPTETKPAETKPKETQPKDTDPESDHLQEDVLAVLDKIEDFIENLNKAPVATEPDTTEPEVTKPKPTEPEVTKPKPTEPEVTEPEEDPEERKCLVVIDAGHQAKGNKEKEPLGPGAEGTKSKATTGTQGVVTKLPEYELNLQVATKLQKVLEQRGYQVKMIRTTNDVNLSNAERAAIANELKADVFIRIHANGDEKSTTHGIMTICQTAENPYNGSMYTQSKKLSQFVLDEMVEATGGKKMFVWETDTMSGINWSQVPVTIVEMGYMTNPEEDKLLSTEEYQQKLVEGMANGIDRYFSE